MRENSRKKQVSPRRRSPEVKEECSSVLVGQTAQPHVKAAENGDQTRSHICIPSIEHDAINPALQAQSISLHGVSLSHLTLLPNRCGG